MSRSFVERALPSSSVALTIKVDGAPAVHLVYEDARPFEEAAVTVLDQARNTAAWSFDDVVLLAVIFLMNYYSVRDRWPAELRSPSAGRRADS